MAARKAESTAEYLIELALATHKVALLYLRYNCDEEFIFRWICHNRYHDGKQYHGNEDNEGSYNRIYI